MRGGRLTVAMLGVAFAACSSSGVAETPSSTTRPSDVPTVDSTMSQPLAVEAAAGCNEAISPGVSQNEVHPQAVAVGPAVFEMAATATRPELTERAGYFIIKHPLTIRLALEESITIRVEDPVAARLLYKRGTDGRRFQALPSTLALEVCGQPVGYAGGFAVTEPSCVRIEVTSSSGTATGGVPVGAPCE